MLFEEGLNFAKLRDRLMWRKKKKKKKKKEEV